ncbi:SDR family oxidoreductase [Achromobacter piechaudii]|uniref:3-oxoacyl-[acyl-carrier-protein] reductase FabG n=1 Tax=Achromobacter piechaudii TaxID=72556 RepID=A0ABN7F6J3_9BURK|nr:SDR family NAD(P)-dependent oxidoreductase [Achromobacter piechaudii]CAB3736313.1 3-oxoacyl-[acyl-carrier-protein] reductase FabG [Achromobacter piechaudii]CAB3923526.1 3-oxoacyl-[acyl-carrier-protein] reductase FabG [Achromobacter piechaudii]CAB3955904.1 3-oxoacyl-[acyl-carrier-protein] reductase FabG [Achromobacter piechaudii]
MNTGLQGQVALVTGAVGGIGSAIVEGLLAQGARVGLVDVNAQAGQAYEKALTERGHDVVFAHADVAHYDSCQAAYERITSELGAATILVNNVGISPKTDGRALKVWEMPPAEWDRVVSVNLNSVFYMTRLATPHMVKQRQGRVINMSSVAGKAYCDIVAAHYAATKAGLIGLTRHWAAELGPYDVTVNGLAPGRISTPLLKSVPQEINDAVAQVTALRRLGTPEEVADACLFFASDQARFVTGQVLDVAGGWLMT